MKTPLRRFWLAFFFLLCLPLLPSLAADITSGSSFFLLSDASYGSGETAMVRVEAQDLSSLAEYGGVDVYVYRVKQPLAFLQAQKNLHRIDVNGKYVGAGLSNALSEAWDNWWLGSRLAWRKLFTNEARLAVTKQVPGAQTHPLILEKTPNALNPLYKPLSAHMLVESFRYPVHIAKPVQPPAGVKLSGSSSDFISPVQGNVMIPLGKREPGLYLVEAMVGAHRAVTLVFVSDAIAVTKVSAQQMLVWVADRRNGTPVAKAQTVWSDGVGVLGSSDTDGRGVVTFAHEAAEKTYIYGQDPQGGVFVSENFYYDSEIYNTKLYAVTDRPLYRPGDTVFVKFLGRNFRSARESSELAAGEIKLQVMDANGFPVASQSLQVTPKSGGDTWFRLPENAVAGGYEMRFSFQGDAYGAAFRVAEYQKPHFEINVLPGQNDYKTGQEVKGKIQLVYPDGKPVANARAELTVRAQRLSMIEGDLGYGGQFPLQLKSDDIVTDSKGMADFILPAASDPSRYVITVLATDGAAYRVRATREILIERSAGTFALRSERAFSASGESVTFRYQLLANSAGNSVANLAAGAVPQAAMPVSWDWVKLENRAKSSGKIEASGKADDKSAGRADKNGGSLSLKFAEAGTYTISLRDANGNVVGAASHYVSGGGVNAPQGSIEMVFDKTDYKPGDTASALVTFPQAVDQALLTLERDQVEKTALLTDGGGWVRAKRLSPTQWRLELPVQENYGPNITLSLVYVKGGEYVFQNLGLRVAQPKIDVAVQADKAVYAPGDKVTLTLNGSIGGKPAAGSMVTIGVVDEMIYVLQPEIAPDLFDFFYHPRRNNVRTSSSLSFIAYDLARPPSKPGIPARSQTHERALKVLERPRRDDKDTAFWQPALALDANGRATVSFIMPDSLTRWRVTVRAANTAGIVGQNLAWLRSSKDFYLKWTSPNWLRANDAPNASIAMFNQTNQETTLALNVAGSGATGSGAAGSGASGNFKRTEQVKLKPGANFFSLPLKGASGNMQLELALAQNGKRVDALSVPLSVVPVAWQSRRSISLPLTGFDTALKLPPDASNLRLQLADGAGAQFHRLIDDLIDYPYGCVEQTSSRLIPYSLALQAAVDERMVQQLSQRLHGYRFRLAQMAGPEATFGWWSAPKKDADPFMTAYAYYADWHASRALKLALPPEHFDRLLEVYSSSGVKQPHWQRALMLYWMQEMGLPMRSLAEALAEELGTTSAAAGTSAATPVAANVNPLASSVLADENNLQTAMSTVLTSYVLQQSKGAPPAAFSASLGGAVQRLQQAGLPLTDALLLLAEKRPPQDAAAILERVRAEYPTIDRALTLQWSYRALAGNNPALLRGQLAKIALDPAWQGEESITGQRQYRWPAGSALPSAIKLASAPPAGTTAVLRFDSRENESSSLPLQLQRRLYRMVAGSGKGGKEGAGKESAGKTVSLSESTTFNLELLPPDAVLKTDEVYLDEIVLKQTSGTPLRLGILEVPLPPGMNADRTTWGIRLQYPAGKESEALEKARFEPNPRGYAVPVDELNGSMTIHHLLRAGQTGKFMLPPARYYRMYQPEQKAIEEKARAAIEIR